MGTMCGLRSPEFMKSLHIRSSGVSGNLDVHQNDDLVFMGDLTLNP